MTYNYGSRFLTVVDFGADPTGTADSTTAFHNAMVAGPALVPAMQPNGSIATYKLSNCLVPSGASLIGFSAPGYYDGGINSSVVVRPIIAAAPSAVRIFNVDNQVGILFDGLQINAGSTTTPYSCDGISAGSMSLTIRDCLIVNCRYGLGGSVSHLAAYDNGTQLANIYNTVFQKSIRGIYNLTDAFMFGGSVTTCTNGIYLDDSCATASSPGGFLQACSSINLIGVRYEWCGRTATDADPAGSGYGLLVTVTSGGDVPSEIHVVGGEFDANGVGGIGFLPAYACNVTGVYFQRNGVNRSSGTTLITTSAHILFNGSYQIIVTGCTSRGDVTDEAVYGPRAFANFAGSNGGISFVGNDMSGYIGTTAGATANGAPLSSNTLWRVGTAPSGSGVGSLVLKSNIGTGTAAQDVDTR